MLPDQFKDEKSQASKCIHTENRNTIPTEYCTQNRNMNTQMYRSAVGYSLNLDWKGIKRSKMKDKLSIVVDGQGSHHSPRTLVLNHFLRTVTAVFGPLQYFMVIAQCTNFIHNDLSATFAMFGPNFIRKSIPILAGLKTSRKLFKKIKWNNLFQVQNQKCKWRARRRRKERMALFFYLADDRDLVVVANGVFTQKVKFHHTLTPIQFLM